MEIIKDFNIKERVKRIAVGLKRGEVINLNLKKNKEVIIGRIIKHSGKYFALEVGRKKLKVQVRIPKRQELNIDLKA
uniref:mp04-like protein n=1 Tax=Dictyostelium intermedium TaxID=361076 RepID=UPI001D121B4F|nr:mp04-like protein [Dictyostelium intermedium]DAZ85378.1 TPA_asm: mp04-like protein [Dictyostelium intermedium]